MVSLPELGPLFLAGAAAIFIYFVRRLRAVIQQPEESGQELDILGNGLTARALYGLGKSPPNFSSLVKIMHEDLLKAGGDRFNAGRDCLERVSLPSFRYVVNTSDFNNLYNAYAVAMRQIEGGRGK